jgi:hypothetical protein
MIRQQIQTKTPTLRQEIHTQDGRAASVEIESTITGEAGTDANVENVGTSTEARLVFTIPRGSAGKDGTDGKDGKDGTDGVDGKDGHDGKDGADGQAASVTVDSTVTGEPGTNANVENVGDSTNARLIFTIPRGAQGAKGEDGKDGDDYVLTQADKEEIAELAKVTTNSNKTIKAITRNSNGSYIRVLIETTDGTFYNIVGIPDGTAGQVLRESANGASNAEWESVDSAVKQNSAALVTSGAVYAAIQAAITDALAASY